MCASVSPFTQLNADTDKILDIPLCSQSDPGMENWGFAKGHTYLRHQLDPDLQGTIQNRWRREKKNIPPEIFWSNLRRRFTPGFEDILSAP